MQSVKPPPPPDADETRIQLAVRIPGDLNAQLLHELALMRVPGARVSLSDAVRVLLHEALTRRRAARARRGAGSVVP